MDSNNPPRMEGKGIFFIISAPSGAGKTTLCNKAVEYFPSLRLSISHTTRRPRKDERDGVDYHFVLAKTFQEMFEKGEFLECAEVHGNRYGTSINEVRNLLDQGFDLLFEIDVQGAEQIKDKLKDGAFIFLLPPSLEACKERLQKRGGDTDEEISSRLKRARSEIEAAFWYDYFIINDTIDEAFEKLKSIIIAEKNRTIHMRSLIKTILNE